MSKLAVKVGRPITALKTAKAEYADKKAAAARAAKEFKQFEEYCIDNGLMEKEVEAIVPILNPATERKKYKRTWSDGKAV